MIINSDCIMELVDSDGVPTNVIKFRDVNHIIYKPRVSGQTFADVFDDQVYSDFVDYVQGDYGATHDAEYWDPSAVMTPPENRYFLALNNLAFSLGSGLPNDDWTNMDFHPQNAGQAQGRLNDGTFHVKENGGQYGNPNALPYYYRQDYTENPIPTSEFSFQNPQYKDLIPIHYSKVSIHEGSVEEGIESIIIGLNFYDQYTFNYVFGMHGGDGNQYHGLRFKGNSSNNDGEDLYQSDSNPTSTVVPSINQGWGDIHVDHNNSDEQDPQYNYYDENNGTDFEIPIGLDILFGLQCQLISYRSETNTINTINSSISTFGRYKGTNDEDAIVKQFQLNISSVFGVFTAPNVYLEHSSVYVQSTDTVNQGQTISMGTQFALNDFSGEVSVFVVDKDDEQMNIDGFFAQFSLMYSDVDNRANYGTVDFSENLDQSHQGWGVRFDVNPNMLYTLEFTYTASVVLSGEDRFTVYLHLGTLIGDNPEWTEWWEEFYPNSLRLLELGSNVIFVDEYDQPVYGCTDSTAVNYDENATFDDGSCVYYGDEGVEFEVATGEDYDPDPLQTMVVNPSDVMFHLIEQELGYKKRVDKDKIIEARNNQYNWKLGFSINKEIDSKKLLQEIARSSKCIPTFTGGRFSYAYIQNTYTGNEQIFTIKQEDVIKYNTSRTPLDEIYTEVEVKYQYDYGFEKYLESTGKLKINEDYFENAYGVTMNYGDFLDYDSSDITQKNNYYGLNFDKATNTLVHLDTSHLFESDYIRKQDSGTAYELAEHLLLWHCNQHNIIDISLPLKYYNLEVGDLIEFDDMILGKKIYNEKYVVKEQADMPIRCGQYILPLFMITDVTKTIKGLKLKLIQLHHLSKSDLVWRDVVYESTENPALNGGGTVWGSGDLNGDGLVNVLDLVLLVDYVMTASPYNETFDINGDGNVNVLDVVILVEMVLEANN